MGIAVFYGIVVCPITHIYVVEQAVYAVGFDFQVGCDAATIAHLTTVSSVKHIGEAIGHTLCLAVGIALRIVDFLYEASAGDVIFGNSHLQESLVGQRTSGLHQTLAK